MQLCTVLFDLFSKIEEKHSIRCRLKILMQPLHVSNTKSRITSMLCEEKSIEITKIVTSYLIKEVVINDTIALEYYDQTINCTLMHAY